MGPMTVTNLVIAGCCFAIGILHLALFVRRRESRIVLIFAIMVLAMAVGAFIEAFTFRLDDIATYSRYFKWMVTANGIMWTMLVWFIAAYTGSVRRWLAILVTAGYATATLINVFSAHSILFLNIDKLINVTLPWGEQIVTASGPAHPLRIVADVSWLLLIYLAVESCIRMGRRGKRRKAIVFGLVMFWTLGIAYVHGTLLDLGLVPPPPLHNISFMLLILIMSSSMINDLLTVPVLKQQVALQLERWQSLIEQAKVLIFGLDKRGRFSFVNRHFTETTGFTETDLVDRSLVDIVPDAEKESLGKRLDIALSEGRLHDHTERPLMTKNGAIRHIRWSHVLLRESDQSIAGTLSVGEDITEKKLAEHQIRTSEERYKIVSENTYDWEFWRGSDGGFRYVSPACEKITGYAADEMISNPELMDRIVHPEDRARYERHQTQSEVEKIAEEIEYRIMTRDGRIRWIGHACLPVFDKGGTYLGVRGSNRDITLTKQVEIERDQALEELRAHKNQLEEENLQLREELLLNKHFEKVVGSSNAILYVLERVRQVAETDAGVLLQGETGVGKELIANAIHSNSQRADKPFIKVNCAALPHHLVESELFGHEPGAFTGADRRRKGRFELAHGGTLLLDEISEIPLEAQAKLLRVLQERQFERVGGSETITVDVRIIATTNRNLKTDIAKGLFRADLFYRLNVYPITVPPLRNRREDIPLLVNYFIPQIAAQMGKKIDQIAPEAMEALQARDWPGNVRELRNVLERTIIAASSNVLRQIGTLGRDPGGNSETESTGSDWPTMDVLQQRYIVNVLKRVEGRIEGAGGAADILGMKPSTLRHRISRLRIKR